MDPKVWGKHLWLSIHLVSLGYPDHPNDNIKQNYRNYYISLGKVLPCFTCSINYAQHLKELPIEPFLENKEKLFEWTWRLHNIVNRSLGKPEFSLDEAYQMIAEKLALNVETVKKSNDFIWVSLIAAVVLVILVFVVRRFYNKTG